METDILNLDLSPQYRWTNILSKYKDTTPLIKEIIEIMDIDPIQKKLVADYISCLSKNLILELKSIALYTGINCFDLILFNIFVTNFIKNNQFVSKNNCKNIVHVSHIDCISNKLTRLLIKINYVKKSNIIYTAISFIGFVGIFNATSSVYNLSISLYETNDFQSSYTSKSKNINSFTLRRQLDKYSSFDKFIDEIILSAKDSLFTFKLLITHYNSSSIIENNRQYYIGSRFYSPSNIPCKKIENEIDDSNICNKKLIEFYHEVIDTYLYTKDTILSIVMIPAGNVVSPKLYMKVD